MSSDKRSKKNRFSSEYTMLSILEYLYVNAQKIAVSKYNIGNKALAGGMSKRAMPQQQITNFIDVKSVDEYCSKGEKLGGKVVVPKTTIPGMGYYAVCLDTENNSFGIFESNENAK